MGITVLNREPNATTIKVSLLQQAFRKFASTVAGTPLQVHLVTDNHRWYGYNSPAWSDANNIWVKTKTDELGSIGTDELLRIKGMVIHELGHILFTPRERSYVGREVSNRRLWNTFNLLEDNRIENMMVGRLSGIKPWLTHTMLQEFFGDDDQSLLLPLVWGRKYLPQQLVDVAAAQWAHPDLAQEIKDIIDEYITINMARKNTQERAVELVVQMDNIWRRLSQQQHDQEDSKPMPSTSIHKGQSSMPEKNGGDDMAGIREQDAALQGARSNQQAKSQESNSDASQSQQSQQGQQSQQADDIKGEIDKLKEQAKQEIVEDIKDMMRGMRDNSASRGAGKGSGDKQVKPVSVDWTWNKAVNPDAQLIAKSFARHLTELKALYDPAWVSRQSEGRLNAREFLMGAELDESFDLWDDSKSEATEIEAVILLDISGSMAGLYTPAFEAMWGIKRALDSISASTSVVVFGTKSSVLYKANERADLQMKYNTENAAGTDPYYGLVHARETLLNSNKAIKLLITITDGAWDNSDKCNNIISEMRNHGVLTSLVYIIDKWTKEGLAVPDSEFHIDAHTSELVHIVSEPHDLIKLAQSMVSVAQRRLQLS